MKSFRGIFWGTVIGISLTAAQVWAQSQMATDQPQPDQVQQEQVQPPPAQKPDLQIAPAPSPEPTESAAPEPGPAQPSQPEQAQSEQAQQQMSQAPPPPPGVQQDQSQADAPDRVARLQFMSGSVSIQPQGTGDWVSGVLNRPLTNGDNVWADKDSRVELNVGDGLLRLGSESSLTLSNVGDSTVQVELHQGALNLRVRRLFTGETFEVDTPNMAFTVQKIGEYRFDVDPNGDATVATVWKGEGEATGNGPAVQVRAHERARFTNGTSLTHDISPAPAYDNFDQWSDSRDQRDDRSVSSQYVAPGTIGSEDLDEYGSWRNTDSYGEVWYPSGVAADWAPYHSGHWVWIAPWGWTWVDDEPWGFAPFHYGRWIYGGGGWGWAPGPYYGRAFYAPALVAWFGGPRFGAGFGFGFGGGIGWCPLGWGEPFFPWYRGSWGYFSHVNFYNTRIGNINGYRGFYHGGVFAGGSFHYANLRGAIAVPQRTLSGSLSVRSNAVRMPLNQFSRSSMVGRVPVSPTRESRLGATAGRATSMAPSRSFARPTASRFGASANARFGGSSNFGGRSASFAGRPSGNFGADAGGRNVPRPPQNAGGSFAGRGNAPMGGSRSYSPSMGSSSHNVPRPPSSMGNNSRSYGSPAARSAQGNGGYSRPGNSAPRSAPDSGRGRNFTSVPRPSGNGYASSNGYASNGYGRSSYSQESRSYGGNSNQSYGGSRSYGGGYNGGYNAGSSRYNQMPATRSYSAPSNRGYSSQSYRGYSAPAQRSYSAPSAGRSYGGGSYGGGSSFHGSSGGSSGGGSHYSGGGGGGGSHGGGGGHGGHR